MRRRIPLWLKVAFTAWIAVWAPLYWQEYGARNFLYFCDLANFILVAAVWIESPLLFSTQTLSVLLVQVLWGADFLRAFLFHQEAKLGAGYMFQDDIKIGVRALSLFHLWEPILLLWAVRRLGYHRRALLCQTLFSVIVLAATWLLTQEPRWREKDVNWVWAPFHGVQHTLAPVPYLLLAMVCYPIILYVPTHLFLRWFARVPASVDTPDRAG